MSADVTVSARMDLAIKRAITAIAGHVGKPFTPPMLIDDADTKRWVVTADVAAERIAAFTSRKKDATVSGRLVVRRIPELNEKTVD